MPGEPEPVVPVLAELGDRPLARPPLHEDAVHRDLEAGAVAALPAVDVDRPRGGGFGYGL